MPKDWLWIDASTAATLASNKHAMVERLRLGHGFLELEQFVSALGSNEMRIIMFKNGAAALIAGGKCLDGLVLNILTVQGSMQTCEEAVEYFEQAAREAGANLIVSVGHTGWARMMKRKGYDVKPRLIMRKVLQ